MRIVIGCLYFLFLHFGSAWVSVSNPQKTSLKSTVRKSTARLLGLPWRIFATPPRLDEPSSLLSPPPDQPIQLNGIERVFILSDLHTDHEANQNWLQTKVSESAFSKRDLIVVAGDISHDMDTFYKSMTILVDKAHVVFVPGNHEAWVDVRNNNKANHTSFQKLEQVYKMCNDLGVITKSTLVRNSDDPKDYCPYPLWIVPLESWYDGTLSFNEELGDLTGWPWADFRRCVWPNFPPPGQDAEGGPLPMGLVEFFLEKNEPILMENPYPTLFPCTKLDEQRTDPKGIGIMTVSHFLPNKQTLPDWKELDDPEFRNEWLDHGAGGMSAKFAKVAGSSLLDQQIRRLLPSDDDDDASSSGGRLKKRRHMHVFGHSHRPKDFEYKGIRYIHNPLGKPRERQLHMVSPDVDFQLVWNTRSGEIEGERILRYWEEKGGGVEALQRRLEKVKPRGRYNRHKGSAFKTINAKEAKTSS